MRLVIPHKIRALLYVVTAIGTPLIAYLAAKQVIGDLEVALWSAEVVVVSGIAVFNINKDK